MITVKSLEKEIMQRGYKNDVVMLQVLALLKQQEKRITQLEQETKKQEHRYMANLLMP